jgi:hypothetical protein
MIAGLFDCTESRSINLGRVRPQMYSIGRVELIKKHISCLGGAIKNERRWTKTSIEEISNSLYNEAPYKTTRAVQL